MPDDQDQESVYHQEGVAARYVVFLTYDTILSWGQVVEGEELTVRLGYLIGKNHGIYKSAKKNKVISNAQVLCTYVSMDEAFTNYKSLIDLDETSPLSEKALRKYLHGKVEAFENEITIDTARRIRNGTYNLEYDLEPSYKEAVDETKSHYLMQNVSNKVAVPNWAVILVGAGIGGSIGIYANESYGHYPSWEGVHAFAVAAICTFVGGWLANYAVRKLGL